MYIICTREDRLRTKKLFIFSYLFIDLFIYLLKTEKVSVFSSRESHCKNRCSKLNGFPPKGISRDVSG